VARSSDSSQGSIWALIFPPFCLSGGTAAGALASGAGRSYRFRRFGRRFFSRRTPGPPPFSSRNSTPAVSSALLITSSVARRDRIAPASSCRTVTIPTPARSANCCWLQSRRPRAALHCSGVITSHFLSGQLSRYQFCRKSIDFNIDLSVEKRYSILYQHLLLTAEKKFWRSVESGEPPRLFGIELPRPRIEAIRIVDMSSSNSWAEFAALYRNTRVAHIAHEKAKTELKSLLPEDAREGFGHGVHARRSRSGAVSFDLLETESGHAPVQ
jgi:hypothetical protein